MILDVLLSFFLVWCIPYALCLFNPFYLPVSSLLMKRSIAKGCLLAYVSGLIRDVFLATPLFGIFGLSTCISTACTSLIVLNFSLDGFLGSVVISFFLSFFDVLVSFLLNFFLSSGLFLSWKSIFLTIFLTILWQTSSSFSRALFVRRRT
jgi:hypothetical protein